MSGGGGAGRSSEAAFLLRAGRDGDLDFLCRLHAEAMGPSLADAYDGATVAAIRRRVAEQTDPMTHDIVEVEGEPIGCRWVRQHADELELVRLWLLPAEQGRGIGSRLVSELCRHATACGQPVRLRVMRRNPAHRLYERFGFVRIGETDTHFLMRFESNRP